jgi:5'-deoxynucleotidase YfbR-like HD superfamily hydrolase
MSQEAVFEEAAQFVERFDAVRGGGGVRRYHTYRVLCEDTVASHSWGVATIVDQLYNGRAPAHMLRAALYHDVAEAQFGDIPSPAKRLMDRPVLDKMEHAFLHERKLAVEVTAFEKWILKIADIIDGLCFCMEEIVRGNRTLISAWNQYRSYLIDQFNKTEFSDEGVTYTAVMHAAGMYLGVLQSRMEHIHAIGK